MHRGLVLLRGKHISALLKKRGTLSYRKYNEVCLLYLSRACRGKLTHKRMHPLTITESLNGRE